MGGMGGGAIEELFVELSADTRGFIQGVDRAVDGGSRRFGQLTRNLQREVAKWGRIAAIAGGAVAVASVKIAADFESITAQTVGLTGVTVEEMERIRQKLLQLAPALGKSPKELAEAFYFAASGIDDTDKALAAMEVSARAAAAGLGDSGDVTRAVVAVMNAYNLSADEAVRVTDVLVGAIKYGSFEAGELAGSLGRVIPMAAQLGVSFEQVAASMATMSNVGISAAESATALNAVMNVLLNPTAEAKEMLEGMGTSAAELRSEVRERGLAVVLLDLMRAFEGNEDALTTLIPNVRALRAVLATAGAQADDYERILEKVTVSQGLTAEAFEAASDTMAFEWKQLLATLQVFAVRIGTELIPHIRRALENLTPHMERFGGWLQADLPSAIGKAQAVISAFVRGIQSIIDALNSLNALIPVIFAAIAGLALAFAWASPGWAVLIGLAAVVTAIGLMGSRSVEVKDQTSAAFAAMEVSLLGAMANINRGIAVTLGMLEGLVSFGVIPALKLAGVTPGWLPSELAIQAVSELETSRERLLRSIREYNRQQVQAWHEGGEAVGEALRLYEEMLPTFPATTQEIQEFVEAAATVSETVRQRLGLPAISPVEPWTTEFAMRKLDEFRRHFIEVKEDLAAPGPEPAPVPMPVLGEDGEGAAEALETLDELTWTMLRLAVQAGLTGGALASWATIVRLAVGAAERLGLTGEELEDVFRASGESFRDFARRLAASEALDILRRQVDEAVGAIDALRSAFSELFGRPTRESAQLQYRLAQLRLQRAGMVAAGASDEALEAVDKEMRQLEAILEVRRAEEGVLRARLDLADKSLLTDAERWRRGIDLVQQMGDLSGAVQRLVDVYETQAEAMGPWLWKLAALIDLVTRLPYPTQLLTAEHGGIVPGPEGMPQLAVVHGRELITAPGTMVGAGLEISMPLNVNVQGVDWQNITQRVHQIVDLALRDAQAQTNRAGSALGSRIG